MSESTNDYIHRVAHLYDVTVPDLMKAWTKFQVRVSEWREPDIKEIESVADDISPYQPGELVRNNAIDPLKRAACIHWARAARVPASEVLAWYDAHLTGPHPRVNMTELGKAFPIDLPHDASGLVDLADAVIYQKSDLNEGALNHALIFDQLAEVNYAMTWGGDDNWFDYLPDGLAILTMLQAENWYDPMTVIINNEHLFAYPDEDEDGAIQSQRDTISARYELEAISMQDVVSGLIYALTEDRDDNDPNIYLPERLAAEGK